MSGSDVLPLRKDAYTVVPSLWFAAISWTAFLPLIFDRGGILPGPAFLLGALLFFSLIVAWLILMVIAAAGLRWRRLFSIAMAGVIAASVGFVAFKFRDEIRFQLVRPIYLAQAWSVANAGGAKRMTWFWTGDSRLVYDETDSDNTVQGIEALNSEAKKMSSLCHVEVRDMAANFFLETRYC